MRAEVLPTAPPLRSRPRAARWVEVALLGALGLLALFLATVQSAGGLTWPTPGAGRVWAALGAVAVYLGLSARWLRPRGERPRSSLGRPVDADGIVIVHASQSGFARTLAERSAQMLPGAVVMGVDALEPARLARARHMLFVVSTTGEGEPPDTALGFARELMTGTPSLTQMEYGLLALGDRRYTRFCAFGRELDHWLQRCGARALFDRIEVDQGDDGALQRWQQHLVALGATASADWRGPDDAEWRLVRRRHTNAGSPGAPVFHLRLEAESPVAWRAGDIAEVAPCQPRARVLEFLARTGHDPLSPCAGQSLADVIATRALPAPEDAHAWRGLDPQVLVERLPTLPHREYSIASVPAEGGLELLLRLTAHPDGRPGLGSGWLCRHAAIGARIRLRVRQHPAFHPPPLSAPLILIGNGTGIAGLRAHLAHRAHASEEIGGCWLLFGERSPAHDRPFSDDLQQWQADGLIEALDLAFSRHPTAPRYVQDVLRAEAESLRQWVARGAFILVCGSQAGMAPAVHQVLVDVLGRAQVDALIEQGRYRRDVY